MKLDFLNLVPARSLLGHVRILTHSEQTGSDLKNFVGSEILDASIQGHVDRCNDTSLHVL